MKKYTIVFLLSIVPFLGVNAQKLSKMAPRVVVIGIGEKNQSVDESRFPNLNFYYSPNLKAQSSGSEASNSLKTLSKTVKVNYSGDPEFLETIWNDKEINEGFMLFDKNGVCFTQGYDINRQGDMAARLCINKKSLLENIKDCVKKEKEAKSSKKEMKFSKSDFMIGHKLPDFSLLTPEGKSSSVKDILNGEPCLVLFFNIPSNIDTQKAKESGKNKTGKAFARSLLSGAAGASVTSLFENLESQFFEYDAREK